MFYIAHSFAKPKYHNSTNLKALIHFRLLLIVGIAIAGLYAYLWYRENYDPSVVGSEYILKDYTLYPTDDTTVKSDYPSKNYGEEESLIVDGRPHRVTYMKFDLSEFRGKRLESAKLRVKPITVHTTGQTVRKVSNTSWKESTLTYKNKPGMGGKITEITDANEGESLSIDVLSYAEDRRGKLMSLAIENTKDSDSLEIISKESKKNKPYLLITVREPISNPDPDPTPTVQPNPTPSTTPLPTGRPTPTPTPTPIPTVTPSPTPVITPTPNPGATGISAWISADEVRRLPITGQSGCANGSLCANAWNGIVNIANGRWGDPDLSRYAGLSHSQSVYAGALVAVRCANANCPGVDAEAMRTKVVSALNAIVGTEQDALPPGISGEFLAPYRQFPRYVIAAQLIGFNGWPQNYRNSGKNYVDYMRSTKFMMTSTQGRGATFKEQHDAYASNGNTMGGFARIITSAYLNDRADLDQAWLTFRRYVGDTSVGPNIGINDDGQSWFYGSYSSTPHVGINPAGATCHGTGYPADGAIPADQGRGGLCPSGANTAPGYTQYPWEGLQGIFAQAEVFKRLGYNVNGSNPYQIQNRALLRATEYQWYLQDKFGGDWYDKGRSSWVKHLVYKNYGVKRVDYTAVDGGRNIGFTQWTHQ